MTNLTYLPPHHRVRLKRMAQLLFVLVVVLAPSASIAQSAKAWYPVEVDVWQPPFNPARERVQRQYVALDKAEKQWRICVSIPHLKDAYWIAVNYGLIDEARRLGVGLSIYEAGGYGQLAVQRRQIEECLAKKPDGLIISSISLDGLNDIIERAHSDGIPVLDLINGISSPHIAARAAVSFRDMGYQTGSYLGRLQEATGKPIGVAWFPGPDGAGWVAAGDAGFRDAIRGSAIEILASSRGDTGRAVQGKLVETALDQYGDHLHFIVGTTVTAEAAVSILRRRGLSNRIKVLSYYYSPGVHRGIRRGDVLAAPSDSQALQARIAVDTLVRILENRDHVKHLAPRVIVIDRSNIRGWDPSASLAPRGFRPIFSVNE